MSARTLSALVLGGALVAGLAACGDTDTGTTASGPAAGSSSAAAPATTPASSEPAPSAAPEAPQAGCPVTVDTLVAVLKDKYDNLPAGAKVSDVQCHQEFAIATRSAPDADSEVEVFRYTSGSWRYFVGGSDGYCKGVPADVTKHFRTVGYGGCTGR